MDIVENVLQEELRSGKAEELTNSTPPRDSDGGPGSEDTDDG